MKRKPPSTPNSVHKSKAAPQTLATTTIEADEKWTMMRRDFGSYRDPPLRQWDRDHIDQIIALADPRKDLAFWDVEVKTGVVSVFLKFVQFVAPARRTEVALQIQEELNKHKPAGIVLNLKVNP